MSDVTQFRARTVATIGVAAALVVGGVAAAQSDSQGGSEGGQPQSAGKRPPPGMMMMGPSLKGLTYGELHVQSKDGTAETIRIDQGKIVSVDASSITLSENDGNEVTVTLDGDTKVMAGPPGSGSTVDDLSVGQEVVVSGPEGEAAKVVMAMPKKGDLKGGAPGGHLPPPPSGAQMGS
jgi:hypothetical protein